MVVGNNVYCIIRILNISQISNKVGASSVDSERNMEAVNDPPPSLRYSVNDCAILQY